MAAVRNAHTSRRGSLKTLSLHSAKSIPIKPSDQYRLQGEAFSRAVRGVEPLAYGVEDAICQMRVLDALFRSAETERWEAIGK